MIVATAGHVDHGKTRLVGHLTGVDTDRLDEEKARGLTIDLGFAYTDFDDRRVGFIDVPGHIRFINNMLAGVSAIDAGLLVVAADDGPMPQTREHLAVLDLLGIDRGVVAITKIDRVEPARVDAVRDEIRAMLAGTSFADAELIPTSSETGEGLDILAGHLLSLARATTPKPRDAHFRLAVDRAFSLKGAGLVVTGSVFSGKIGVGDEVSLLPAGTRLRVRSLHRQNEGADTGGAGDRLALNLAGDAAAGDIHRGNWIASVPAPATTRIDARVRVLPGARAITHWMPAHLHTAANHVTAHIATLEGRSIEPGESGLVQFVLDTPINAWRGDRLIIRDQAAEYTLGGGIMLDPAAPARGRTRAPRMEYLRALAESQPDARIAALLQVSAQGFDWDRFVTAETAPRETLQTMLEDHGGTRVGNVAIARARAEAIARQMLDEISGWFKQNPTSDSLTVADLTEITTTPRALINPILERLVAARLLATSGGSYRLPNRQAELDPAAAKLWSRVEPILAREPLKPPVLHDLAAEVNLPPKAIAKLLGHCVHAGLLVRPTENRFFLPDAMTELFELARRAADAGGGSFTVKQYRDATGVGRNLSIEILEYFDRTGRTIRVGDERKIQHKETR